MSNLLTNPQGSGAMTLDQGVAALKANMASKGQKASDQVKKLEPELDPGSEDINVQGGQIGVDDEVTELPEATEPEKTEVDSTVEPEPEAQASEGKLLLLDGSEVTYEEARKGYLRQADYTRKTQGLASDRESAAAQHAAAMQQVQGLVQSLTQLQETEPNWLQLAQDPNTDPKQLQAAQAYWQQKKQTMSTAQAAVARQQAQALNAQKQAAWETLSEGRIDPTWKDPKVLKGALDKLTSYLVERGLPEDILPGITNPLVLEIAEESRRYRELQAGKPKALKTVQGKPAPMKPGAKSTASPQSENLRLLHEAFNAKPTVDNAVALQRAKAGR